MFEAVEEQLECLNSIWIGVNWYNVYSLGLKGPSLFVYLALIIRRSGVCRKIIVVLDNLGPEHLGVLAHIMTLQHFGGGLLLQDMG